MANYANVIDNIAIDVSANPEAEFHPDVAQRFVLVPDEVRPGWTLAGGTWAPSAVELAPAGPTYRTLMTPIRFEEQFEIDEQLDIEDRRAYDGADEALIYQKRVLNLLFGKLKDQRLLEVDVADPSVIKGIDFCQWVGILTAERAATIKAGIPA
ncbi:MAG: hypothetical protein K2Y56_24160 [Methylobacterium sp.]|uniref:hypothetical protein n=1 Tax=Methylobacterium sp. TaxID=409 RepID=UPI0025EBC397|nr:hypothetical protein [Methylobacterium sp.]MBX9934573.1 hypothetical protein [Methylobacterium sp.]